MSQALFRTLPIAAILAAMAFLLVSSASAQSGQARIRVLHASPDAPNVDIYLDDAEAISDLAYESITDYTAVPAGAHNVKVYPASANSSGAPVIEADVTLAAGVDYTVAAVGTLAEIEGLVLEDNNAAPAAGKAHVRVVHASPDAPNVDIFAEGAGVVVPNLPFKDASDYLPLDAGTYNIEVRAAGTETVAIDLPNTALEAGKVYSVFAIGLLAGEPSIEAKVTVDATVAQPTATTAAATTAPTAAPQGTVAGALPSSGGPIDDGSSLSLWLVAGAVLIALGVAAGSLSLARARVDHNDS